MIIIGLSVVINRFVKFKCINSLNFITIKFMFQVKVIVDFKWQFKSNIFARWYVGQHSFVLSLIKEDYRLGESALG